MKMTYKPTGVCCKQMDIEVENNVVVSVEFTGGCPGGLAAIKRVVEGKMEADFYIDLIEAIADCDFRIREGANPRIQLEALLTKFI